jgi:hypothetical protein
MIQSVNSPKWAFEKLLESFNSIESPKNLEENLEDKTLKSFPPCLQKSTAGNQSGQIPCLICGRLFKTSTAIVEHSNHHLSEFKVKNCRSNLHLKKSYPN